MKKIIVLCILIISLSYYLLAQPQYDLSIEVYDNDIYLLWSDTTDAYMYYIYRSTEPYTDFDIIDSSFITCYTDIDAKTKSTSYFYYITAVHTTCPTFVEDNDGNVYETIEIGDQCWMAENLKVTTYRNDELIPQITDKYLWAATTSGAYCYYDNDPFNADTYGALYNWYAVNDARELAPVGWHIPTDNEIMELEIYLGMEESQAIDVGWRGTNEGSKLAGREDLWTDGVLDSNSEFGLSGFKTLPGGCRWGFNLYFADIGNRSYFWSSTERIDNCILAREVSYDHSQVSRTGYEKINGFSVRCLKGDCPTTVEDIDGNVYETVMIGDQCWMAENLKVTTYKNGDEISHLTSISDWISTDIGAYCFWGNDPSNAATYGNLYNWYAVDDSRGICPCGWHVPTDDEIKQLEMNLGMIESHANNMGLRGSNEGSKLAGRSDLWSDGDLVENPAFGRSCFKALPGGYRAGTMDGNFYNLGYTAWFWSSSEYYITGGWNRAVDSWASGVSRYHSHKTSGYSVRCVRD